MDPYVLLVTRCRAEVVHHNDNRIQPGHRCSRICSVGVRYRVELPAGTASVGLARRGTEQVLRNGRVVPGGVVEAARDGGGVAVGRTVAVVEAISVLRQYV